MKLSRRDILRMMLAAPIAYTMDVEKLLWIPNQQIVVPAIKEVLEITTISYAGLTHADIVALEMEKVASYLKSLFERDDLFYVSIK